MARLSNQEQRKEIQPSQFSLFFTAGLQKSGEFGNTAITIYEIDNTPLPKQYRRWMHSTVNQLRQHADDHTTQREYARGFRI